ncbi:MAG: NlpC/P60 family protein [Christensenellales bacterium]|jgi:hypothetical protein
MTKTQAVIDFCIKNVGAAYVYGATGKLCTKEYRRARMIQYPEYASAITKNCPVLSNKQSGCESCKYFNKLSFDCAQLVRRAFQQADISLPSGASSQWLRGSWAYKGPIEEKAKSTLCAVFRSGGSPMKHVGVSLGNGYVVDARGHGSGVIKTAFESYPWTHYAVPFSLDEKGENYVDIKKMQDMLIKAGFSLPRFGIDGRFGSETKKAMQMYQKSRGILISETPNISTYKALLDEAKPVFLRLGDIETRLARLEENNKCIEKCQLKEDSA